MKKTIILGFCLAMAINSYAQTATLESAQELVKNNDLAGAKKAIDEITQSAKDDKNAAAWFTKGYIYQKIADDAKIKSLAPNGNVLAFEAYKKFMSLEKKLDITLVKDNMMALLGNFFNAGIACYNDKKYQDAVSSFEYVMDVKNSDASGKLFAADKIVDTIIAQTKMYKAYSYYNDKKNAEAAAGFEEALANPITKDADIYLRLATIYQNNGDNEKWISTIKNGITAFGNNNDLKNEEINYYLLTNKQDELVKKLEEAIIREPKNAQLLFSLASAYDALIKEKKGADADVFRKKAATTYEKAAAADSKNGDYVYNLGAMYYNQSVEVNENINKNKDNKSMVETLKKSREELMKKSMPYMEKAMGLYETGGVKEADKLNYNNSLRALQKMYDILNMKTQKDAITKKLGNS
jgi:tetratricopeptide (TPR) repeat protein